MSQFLQSFGVLTRFVGVGLVVLSALSISYFSYYRGPDLLKADGTYNGGYEYDVALGLLGQLQLDELRQLQPHRLALRHARLSSQDRHRYGTADPGEPVSVLAA